MTVKLLTERHLEFLSLNGGYTGSSQSTLVKMPHFWKSHVTAQLYATFPYFLLVSVAQQARLNPTFPILMTGFLATNICSELFLILWQMIIYTNEQFLTFARSSCHSGAFQLYWQNMQKLAMYVQREKVLVIQMHICPYMLRAFF